EAGGRGDRGSGEGGRRGVRSRRGSARYRRLPPAPRACARRARASRGPGRGEAAMSETLHSIAVEVNGVRREARVPARLSLVDWLRDELRLTGTHVGCEHGVCGACSVMLDGEAVRSCLMYAVQAHGHRITTVEGLAQPDGAMSVL